MLQFLFDCGGVKPFGTEGYTRLHATTVGNDARFPFPHYLPVFLLLVKLARDALEIHAPLAHRLGVHHLSGGLEDLAFEALYPAEYNQVGKQLRKLVCRLGLFT